MPFRASPKHTFTGLILLFCWASFCSGAPRVIDPHNGEKGASLESAIPELDFSPQDNLVVSSQDTANWILSYPAVLPLTPPPQAAWAEEAKESVGRGAFAETIFLLESTPPQQQDADWRVFRANLLLRIGMVEEADLDLQAALKLAPNHPKALALASVVASVRGRMDDALDLGRRATRLDPASGTAWLALSYTQQAQGDLEAALDSTRQAQTAAPDNGTCWTREAELHLAQGRMKAAQAAADRALTIQPDSSIAQSTRALVALLQQDSKLARSGFEHAVRINPVDANARFGLSLAHIQNGNLSRAREELLSAIERAPNNGLFHAYLGRVYLGLGEEAKARDEFNLSGKLDPNSSASWLFKGQAALHANRPASALTDIQEAATRNAGRRVYRGSKLLDEDMALNHIDQSRAYEALGFRAPALEQARMAMEYGCCAAALRNLADAYTLAPHGIQARRSLALQSLFDAPPGLLPLGLDMVQGVGSSATSVPGHALPDGLEPRPAGLNEYSALFAPAGWQLAVDGNLGGFGTWGEQFRLGGRIGGLGIGFAQLIQVSDGPDGKALNNRNWQFQLQAQINSRLSTFLEYRHATSIREELLFAYDPILVTPMSLDERVRVARLGASIQTSPGGSLRLLFARQWRGQDVDYPAAGFSTQAPGQADMPEIQYRHVWDNFILTLGSSRFHDNGNYFFSGSPASTIDVITKLTYAYGILRPIQDLALTLGLSRVDFHQDYSNITEYNRTLPKFGLHWAPFAGASLRIAALEAAALPKAGGASLEPMEVAGVQQWFGEELGTVVRRLAVNWEQKLTPSLSLVLEAGNDRLSIPGFITGATTLDRQYERWNRAGLYWRLPPDMLTAWEGGLRLTYDRLEQDRPNLITDNNNIRRQLARHWNLGARLAGPHGLGLQVSLTRVDARQRIEPITVAPFEDQENFWMADLALTRTFNRGKGQLSLGVRNATDRDMGRYQEADPLLPRFAPSRYFYSRLQWQFD